MDDDVRAIEAAKTEYRDGYNTGDIDRVLSVFADGFIDLSAGQPGFYGGDARRALEFRLHTLFRDYNVQMFVIIATVSVSGDLATDWGWHKIWLTPKGGGETRYAKFRYSENWKRVEGEWRISLFMSDVDPRPELEPFNEAESMKKMTTAPAPTYPPQVGASFAH
jgi:ketosteroid isomerase-like protein